MYLAYPTNTTTTVTTAPYTTSSIYSAQNFSTSSQPCSSSSFSHSSRSGSSYTNTSIAHSSSTSSCSSFSSSSLSRSSPHSLPISTFALIPPPSFPPSNVKRCIPSFVALSPMHPPSHARFLLNLRHHYDSIQSCRFVPGLFQSDFVISSPWMNELGTCILKLKSLHQAKELIQQCQGMQWKGLIISAVLLPEPSSFSAFNSPSTTTRTSTPTSTTPSSSSNFDFTPHPTPPPSLHNEPMDSSSLSTHSSSPPPPHPSPFSSSSSSSSTSSSTLSASNSKRKSTLNHHEPRTNVYLSNLSLTISEAILEKIFSKFGPITSCKVLRTPQGVSRKIAFVNFIHPSSAQDAVSSVVFVDSKQIRVSFAFNDYLK